MKNLNPMRYKNGDLVEYVLTNKKFKHTLLIKLV